MRCIEIIVVAVVFVLVGLMLPVDVRAQDLQKVPLTIAQRAVYARCYDKKGCGSYAQSVKDSEETGDEVGAKVARFLLKECVDDCVERALGIPAQ